MTSPWEPGVNGAGKRPWFLIRRDETIPIPLRYHYNANGYLIKYASHQSAQRAADRLNREEKDELLEAIRQLGN